MASELEIPVSPDGHADDREGREAMELLTRQSNAMTRWHRESQSGIDPLNSESIKDVLTLMRDIQSGKYSLHYPVR